MSASIEEMFAVLCDRLFEETGVAYELSPPRTHGKITVRPIGPFVIERISDGETLYLVKNDHPDYFWSKDKSKSFQYKSDFAAKQYRDILKIVFLGDVVRINVFEGCLYTNSLSDILKGE